MSWGTPPWSVKVRPDCRPFAPGSHPIMWSKDRFSIMTTTMWSIPLLSGDTWTLGGVVGPRAAARPTPVAPTARAPAPTAAAPNTARRLMVPGRWPVDPAWLTSGLASSSLMLRSPW